MKLNKIVSSILSLSFVTLGITSVYGVERRPINDVPLSELIRETEIINSNTSEFLDLVWWIPLEYWQTYFVQSGEVDSASSQQFLDVFASVFIVATLQADTSAIGLFDFFSQSEVEGGMVVTYEDEDGNSTSLKPIEPSEELALLLEMVKPALSSVIGQLGTNMHFIVFSDVDSEGDRQVSPFQPGNLQVSLNNRQGQARSIIQLEFPLNSLFIPRICPNGKPAHISWKYCPWDGTELED